LKNRISQFLTDAKKLAIIFSLAKAPGQWDVADKQ